MSLWLYQWILSANKNLHLRVDAIHVIGCIVTIVLSTFNNRQERSKKNKGKNIDDGMSFLKEGECRSILAKPADKSCRRKKHSQTLKGIDEL